jgi:hypothetical protein
VKWLTLWQLVRDILLTGTGIALIVSQIGARDPSSELIVAGLALTVPAAATHAAGVLSGSPGTQHGQPPSSSPSPPPSSSPSPPTSAGSREAGG